MPFARLYSSNPVPWDLLPDSGLGLAPAQSAQCGGGRRVSFSAAIDRFYARGLSMAHGDGTFRRLSRCTVVAGLILRARINSNGCECRRTRSYIAKPVTGLSSTSTLFSSGVADLAVVAEWH